MNTPPDPATAYDMVYLADDEWGNETMKAVAGEWFTQHPACNFVMVYEHAGWWLAYHRSDLECVGTANDLAVMRADRPQPTHYSGNYVRR